MHFKIKIDIFDTTIDYYIGNDEIENFIKILKNRGVDTTLKKEDFETSNGLVVSDYVWIRNKSEYSAVVHENCHIVQNLMAYYNLKGNEIEAYISGYLFKEYLKKIN